MDERNLLGKTVKDKITGLKGVVVGVAYYLYGCVRVAIQPKELKDGAPVDAHWCDEPQVAVVKGVKPIAGRKEPKYGPRKDPRR